MLSYVRTCRLAVFAVLLLSILTSCGASSSKPPVGGESAVIFGVSSQRQKLARYSVFWYPYDRSTKERQSGGIVARYGNEHRSRKDLSYPTYHVLAVEPGTHIHAGGFAYDWGGDKHFIQTQAGRSVAFHVGPGEVVYIGNFDLTDPTRLKIAERNDAAAESAYRHRGFTGLVINRDAYIDYYQ